MRAQRDWLVHTNVKSLEVFRPLDNLQELSVLIKQSILKKGNFHCLFLSW